jgi:two-component system response regulator FixJ
MSGSQLVHIVDDDEAVRSSIALVMSLAGLPCIAWPSAAAFLSGANLHSGGCAILDLMMPVMDGLALQEELKRRESNIAVLMLTGHGDIGSAVKALKAGAVDFIEKPFDNDDLVARVQAAVQQQQQVRVNSGDAKARIATLSGREAQVLQGLTNGKSSKEIARDLGLSPRTIEMHRSHLMERLGVRKSSEAIRLAVQAEMS